MRAALRHPLVYAFVAAALGAVFLYASYDKILHPAEFARIVYHYRLLGPSARLGYVPPNLWAVTLPWIEAVTGLCLVTGLWRREAAIVTGGLLVVFVAAVGYALSQGIDLANCGCFSVSGAGRGLGWRLIAGDLALLAVAAYVVVGGPTVAKNPTP
ncbi:MAG: MauE/DoxX family redox-associated membrane protein [bacterium]